MSSRDFMNVLLNPFEDVTSEKLLIIGIIGFSLMSVLSYSLHFINDGIIQLHLSEPKEYWKCLLNGSINTAGLTLCMFSYGKIVYSKTRFIDVLIAVLIAQLALILVVLITMNPFTMEVSNSIVKELENGNIKNIKMDTRNLIILTISGLLGILLLYYFFHLLVVGMKIAINSKRLVHTISIVLLTLVLDMVFKIIYPYL